MVGMNIQSKKNQLQIAEFGDKILTKSYHYGMLPYGLRIEVIYIANCLSSADYQKPLLRTKECQFKKSMKNTTFDRQFNLRNEQKIDIINSLTAGDCVKISRNDNLRYADAEVYQFIKCVELMVYGENETHKLYFKMYLAEQSTYDIVIVISFRKESEYDQLLTRGTQ